MLDSTRVYNEHMTVDRGVAPHIHEILREKADAETYWLISYDPKLPFSITQFDYVATGRVAAEIMLNTAYLVADVRSSHPDHPRLTPLHIYIHDLDWLLTDTATRAAVVQLLHAAAGVEITLYELTTGEPVRIDEDRVTRA